MHPQDPRYGQPPPGPPPYGPRGPVQPYGQPYPPQPHGVVVSRTGLSGAAHTVHAVLTVLSCFTWSPIWFIHWLVAKRKTVTRY